MHLIAAEGWLGNPDTATAGSPAADSDQPQAAGGGGGGQLPQQAAAQASAAFAQP